VVLSKSGAQIHNPGGTADRETSQEHEAGGAPRGPRQAAKTRQLPYFRGCTGAAVPVLQARDCLPGPFPPDTCKKPLRCLQKGISRV